MQSLEVAGRLSIGYSAARQLFVYTKNSTSYQEMLCKPQHDQAQVGARYKARVGAKLGHAFNCTQSMIIMLRKAT